MCGSWDKLNVGGEMRYGKLQKIYKKRFLYDYYLGFTEWLLWGSRQFI